MWGVEESVVPLVLIALGAVTPKLGEWLQQIPGITSEISVQKSAILGTQDPQVQGLLLRTWTWMRHNITHREGDWGISFMYISQGRKGINPVKDTRFSWFTAPEQHPYKRYYRIIYHVMQGPLTRLLYYHAGSQNRLNHSETVVIPTGNEWACSRHRDWLQRLKMFSLFKVPQEKFYMNNSFSISQVQGIYIIISML